MRLELKGQALYITGRLARYTSQRELERALRLSGASITSDVNMTTTALIVGGGWNRKVQLAAARGLPILTEDHAAALLEHGFIELEDAPAPAPVARDAAIGELRPALSGTPTPQAWSEILAMLDRCPPEQLDELVEYVSAQTGRWDIPLDLRWRPEGADAAPQSDWNYLHPRGELRMPPFRWLVEMLKGEDSPSYRVLRGLTLMGASAKNADVVKLLALPSLNSLTSLHLGANLSVTLWKKLYEAPCAEQLRMLSLITLDNTHIKAISSAPPEALPSVETLRLLTRYRTTELEALEALLETPWASRIKRLELEGASRYREVLDQLTRRDDLLPALTTLHLQLESYFYKLSELIPSALRGVHTLSLGAELHAGYTPNLQNLFALPIADVTCLDLSHMFISPYHTSDPAELASVDAELREAMLRVLPTAPILSYIPQVKLGHWHNQPLVDALTRQGKLVVG